jgi:hypothetical protein
VKQAGSGPIVKNVHSVIHVAEERKTFADSLTKETPMSNIRHTI